jgi:predicted metal-dependent hydrolase
MYDNMKVNYGDNEIEFEVFYKERKTVRVSVKPNLKVEVLAPLYTTDDKIKVIVLKRGSWIINQQQFFEKFLPSITPREYISGETHRYLGRQYRLKVIAADKNDVKLKGKYIYIYTVKKHDREHNKELMYKWYKKHADKKFQEVLEVCYGRLIKYELERPTWSIRKMKSRWGSYQPQKKHVLLNLELIKVDSGSIEYVIMHELCHIKYPNHSKEFYRFLDLVLPEWKERKEKLESSII